MLVVVPTMLLLFAVGIVLVRDRLNEASGADRARVNADVSKAVMSAADEVQVEMLRTASLATGGERMAAQWSKTIAELDALEALVTRSNGQGAVSTEIITKSRNALTAARSSVKSARAASSGSPYGELIDLLTTESARLAITDSGSGLALTASQLVSALQAKDAYVRYIHEGLRHLDGNKSSPANAALFTEVRSASNRATARLASTIDERTKPLLDKFLQSPDNVAMSALSDDFVAASNASGAPGVSPSDWLKAGEAAVANLDAVEDDLFARYAESAAATASSARRDVTVFGVLGTLGLLAAVLGSWLVGRSLTQRLLKVTGAAHDIAVERLPEVLESLRNPTAAAIAQAVPQIEVTSTDEVGQLANDFNVVLRTAIETSVEHSQRRAATLTNLLINLGRRNQALIDRQLELIDSLESKQQDVELLNGLFKLDHMVTRQRRNAESLLVLAGSRRTRGWTEALPISEVLRGAISEVGQMERINLEIQPGNDLLFSGQHAVDMSHLVAELVENATLYSSPATTVTVRVQRGTAHTRVWVIDSGVGMTDEELEHANHRVNDPPDIDDIATDQVGFQVVGRLAQRTGARIRLQNNPAGGVAVSIDLPMSVFEPMPEFANGPAFGRNHMPGHGTPAAAVTAAPNDTSALRAPETADEINWAAEVSAVRALESIEPIVAPSNGSLPTRRPAAAAPSTAELPRRQRPDEQNTPTITPLARRVPIPTSSTSAAGVAADEGAFRRLPTNAEPIDGNDPAVRRRRLLSDFSNGVNEGRNQRSVNGDES